MTPAPQSAVDEVLQALRLQRQVIDTAISSLRVAFSLEDTPSLLDAIPAPVNPDFTEAIKAALKTGPKRKVKPTLEPQPYPAVTVTEPDDPISIANRAAIADWLRNSPHTSGELIKRTGLTSTVVHSALSLMRQDGSVRTNVDAATGQRKNYLVEGAEVVR